MKLVKGLDHKSCREFLRELEVFKEIQRSHHALQLPERRL